jgi:hypothetical protein
MMIDEARLEDVGSGLAPLSPGWFVVNVSEAAWVLVLRDSDSASPLALTPLRRIVRPLSRWG